MFIYCTNMSALKKNNLGRRVSDLHKFLPFDIVLKNKLLLPHYVPNDMDIAAMLRWMISQIVAPSELFFVARARTVQE